MIDHRRVRTIKPGTSGNGPIIYLMARDQRVDDNWALLFAQKTAIEHKQPLIVASPIAADYPKAGRRQIDFIISGLGRMHARLSKLGIPLVATRVSTTSNLISLADWADAGSIVCDFNPLRESLEWKARVAKRIRVPIYEIDAHNIVPVREASDKQEYAAYTIRPKITKKLPELLTPFPQLIKHPFPADIVRLPDKWTPIEELLDTTPALHALEGWTSGEMAAQKKLREFLSDKLSAYKNDRNDPARAGQSDLSPYLHFGQLSAQRVALEVHQCEAHIASQESFLEELIIRRELADNFCYYNDRYDSFDGFPEWAQKTLNEHRMDPRSYLYDRKSLETGQTHDDLWNAAQFEMVRTGKMHGYVRMYWAKKILEWSPAPEEALSRAIYLNNKFELDGHDPNGYAGIAWSVGGVHDRAWSEREIFGKIRYMSLNGCKRKFSVTGYINHISELSSQVSV